jgi:GTP cyclohydrolase III
VYLVITMIQKLVFGIKAPGYASLLIVLLFFNGLLLVSNGIQGEYIARIFEEVKGRPLYVIGTKLGFDASPFDAEEASTASGTVPGATVAAAAPAAPDESASKPAHREPPKPTKPPPIPRAG